MWAEWLVPRSLFVRRQLVQLFRCLALRYLIPIEIDANRVLK